MAFIGSRHAGYKVGLVMAFVAMILFIVGFASNNWCDFDLILGMAGSPSVKISGHAGLWESCFKGWFGESICQSVSRPGWETVVKALEGTAVACLVIATLMAFYINLILKEPATVCQENIFLIGVQVAGGLGVGAVATYGGNISKDADVIQGDYLTGNAAHNFHYTLSWSFGTNTAGSGLLIIAGIVLRVFCRKLSPAGQAAAAARQQQQQQQQQAHQLPPGFSSVGTAGMPHGVVMGPAQGGVQVEGNANYPYAVYTAPPPAYSYDPNSASSSAPTPQQDQMVFNTPMAGYKQ